MRRVEESMGKGMFALSSIVLALLLLPTVICFPFWERTTNEATPSVINRERLGKERLFLRVPLTKSVAVLGRVFPTCQIEETPTGLRVEGSGLVRHLEEVGIASRAIWGELAKEDPGLSLSDDMCRIVFSVSSEETGRRYALLPVAIVAVAIG